ncbi:MAG: TauD/TfdA family dioxygenase [Acidimicrobiales bacterium]|nr:TauD/TfdA family dioxygenase [Acidimicrobiales bacterium]
MAGTIGAEVRGVDLSKAVDDTARAELRALWLEHLVLVFRDQPLTVDAFVDFAHLFGEPIQYPFVPGLAEHPMVIEVTKLPDETVNFGGIWHSDTTYLERPPMASTLVAREVPPFGGDTLFANQYAAFDALTPAMQEMILPLRGVSTSGLADVSKTREDRRSDAAGAGHDAPEEDYETVHPVVRTHPETGRRALYVNVAHTARFDGMTEDESQPLLQYLFGHQVRPEFSCRLHWDVGTIALWDNRCAMHNPINDYHGHRRVMHRITLAGDRPV